MRVAAAALVIGACYQPTVATGVPCASTRDFPDGQACNSNNRCDVPGRDAAIDAPPIPIDAFSLLGWSPPQPLVELNSSEGDTDPSISADGLDIVFASRRLGGPGLTDLYRANRASRTQPFNPPVLIAELSTPLADQAAEISGDALTIYLKVTNATEDIASARRQTRTSPFGMVTGEPTLSSAEPDTNPAISRDGRAFSTTRSNGFARELYLYTRNNQNQPWSTARQLTELSSMNVDSGAAFGADGLVIIFQSDRDSPTIDVNDLYVASRSSVDEPFRDIMPLTALNTPSNESDPTITADLRYIVFECMGDLCYSTR